MNFLKRLLDTVSKDKVVKEDKSKFLIIGGKIVYENNIKEVDSRGRKDLESSEISVEELILEKKETRLAAPLEVSQETDEENEEQVELVEELPEEEFKEKVTTRKRGKHLSIGRVRQEFTRLLKLNLSKSTESTYLIELKFWEKIAKNLDKSLYKLEASDIEKALESYSGRTKVKKVSALKMVSKIYLRSEMYSLSIELEKTYIKKKIDKSITKYLEDEKYLKLKEEILKGVKNKSRAHLWLGLFLFCGLRISEVKTISIENKYIKVLGKGSKERLVPCPSFLLKGIKEIKENGKGGWRSNEKNIDKYLRRNGYLEEFHCHQLRHTYATYLHRHGVDLNVLKKLLGHTTIATTQIYAQAKVDESILELFDLKGE